MTGAGEEGDAGAGEGGDPGGDGGRRLSASKVIGLAGGAIAAIASLTTIISWLAGAFGSGPPHPVIDAEILAADVETVHERLVDYLEETKQSTDGLSRPEAIEEGIRANVRVRFEGTVGEEIPLHWSMLRDDGVRVRGAIYSQKAAVFTPKREVHAREVPVWIPYPPRRGTYKIRFVVRDAEGEPLDTLTTDPFRIPRVPELQQ